MLSRVQISAAKVVMEMLLGEVGDGELFLFVAELFRHPLLVAVLLFAQKA